MSMRDAWDEQAQLWIDWVRTPGHDSFDRFHRDRFLELVPAPSGLTIDVGAGEGRLPRVLRSLGHTVVAVEGSPTLAGACAGHEDGVPVAVGDAARLPCRTGAADLAIAFMSLHDIDDLEGAVAELGRVVGSGGRLCMAIVHPVNSAGRFEGERGAPDRPFVVRGSYFEHVRYEEEAERDGLRMVFVSRHRPLEAYGRALEDAGFVIEAMREVTEPDPDDRWFRVPLFLDLRAVRR